MRPNLAIVARRRQSPQVTYRRALHSPPFALALLLLGCASPPEPDDRKELVEALRQLHLGQTLDARTSLAFALPKCGFVRPLDTDISVEPCPEPRRSQAGPEVVRIAALAAIRSRQTGNADAWHAAGLVDLIWSDGAATTKRSVELLEAARSAGHARPDILVDLSAAYLAQAAISGSPRDLLRSIERSSEAIQLDSTDHRARFNRGLALHRLGVAGEAAIDFRAASHGLSRDDRDSSSVWLVASDRLSREDSLVVTPGAPLDPYSELDSARLEAAVVTDRVRARYFGWDTLLVRWGRAEQAGETVAANEILDAAGRLSRALRRVRSDTSLGAAVNSISRSSGRARFQLARAHQVFGRARSAYEQSRYSVAKSACDSAIEMSGDSPSLRLSAVLWRAISEAQWGDPTIAAPILENTMEAGRRLGFDAILARASSALAVSRMQLGETASALRLLASSERQFRRIGETEHVGMVQSLVAVALRNLGDQEGAIVAAGHAIGSLALNRKSVRLHNALYLLAELSLDDGLARAALSLAREDTRISMGRADAHAISSANAILGRIYARGAMTRDAIAAFARARETATDLDVGVGKQWLLADLQLEEAQARAMWGLPVSLSSLDSCLAFFEQTRRHLRTMPALALRARLRRSRGDLQGARKDFESIVAKAEGELSSVRSVEQSQSLLAAIRSASEQLMLLDLSHGDTTAALLQLERGRSSGNTHFNAVRLLHRLAQSGHTVVDYALVEDSLYAWVRTRDRITLSTRKLTRDSLQAATMRLHRMIALGANVAAVKTDLSNLYSLLIEPIVGALGDTGSVVTVVADGELADLPIAALLDSVSKLHVVERWAIQYEASLWEALRSRAPHLRGQERALLVADPAHDALLHPSRERLVSTRAEVGAIAALYGHSEVLVDTAATFDALKRGGSRSDLVHFAGHTVFDPERPELSELILAGRTHATAAAVRTLNLSKTRLVVLASCEGGRVGVGRSAAQSGLVAAFRFAGAASVLAGTWRIPDGESSAFFIDFHAGYQRTGSPAIALREAQKRALASVYRNRGALLVWAGFRVIGSP
jgi:CHAT domain-containing protein/tetratricopeptide (TPR) repeat protein